VYSQNTLKYLKFEYFCANLKHKLKIEEFHQVIGWFLLAKPIETKISQISVPISYKCGSS
jgi:hypothetical protein